MRASSDYDDTLPAQLSFKCAVTDSKGPRRSMEDAHSIVVPFAGIRGQGFFAIFDGHAGKQAAEWCGANFATCFLETIRRDLAATIPDAFNSTFHDVDGHLSRLSEESDGKMHAGCTAVTAFLRLEDADGRQTFLPSDFHPIDTALEDLHLEDVSSDYEEAEDQKVSNTSRIKNFFKPSGHEPSPPPSQASTANTDEKDDAWTPPHNSPVRRVLYCANVGDARGVLCRAGRAVRLTYDHKGSDRQEAKRIMDAGGFVMSGRVNGVLAVTRSLGDSSMKEFVVGAPYTTETELNEEDEFLILACDGLWDVVDDQRACELVRSITDPRRAAEELLDYAYKNYSTDNVTVLVVRFRNPPESIPTEPQQHDGP
ncbi:phosphatase 2C-like domain-containing protein [Fomitopsis serialis]|uniref:phosphatase 2C-like domain-containing protein n=1 Tax=Fomitopsis serialis TaxID=139415 RepID=UPI00200781A1|nr:phosphatase 2C-like domain-containing protein [Neoantrodia serialis]KAH9935625.1 phosphatase 2C-like domain-containing protein [Neoantrodia serialis]